MSGTAETAGGREYAGDDIPFDNASCHVRLVIQKLDLER